jgi:RNA polymerase sigma-B factor
MGVTALTIVALSQDQFNSTYEDRGWRAQLAERTTAVLTAARSAPPDERSRLEAEVVEDHLWLADSLARRFHHRGEELDDLEQVARAGLVEAVQRFDPAYGPFISFAVPTINGVLKRHFRDHGWLVRPPRRTQELAAEVRRLWPDLAQVLQSDPSSAQLARALEWPVEAVEEARRAIQWYSSSSLDSALARGVVFASEDATAELTRREAKLLLARVWPELTRAEQELLILRFYDELSQAEIAVRIGTSQMQVSRLLARLLRRLRTLIGSLDASSCA